MIRSARVVLVVAAVGGYLSSGAATLHIGLRPTEALRSFQVRWLDGSKETFRGSETRRAIILSRGSGEEANADS